MTHILLSTLLIAPITVRTPRDLDALSIHTYVLAAIVAVGFLALAAVVANLIRFEGGSRPRDPGQRRLWFWILLVAAIASVFSYNMYGVAPHITPSLQSRFLTTNAISAAVTAAVYLLLGFVLSRVFATGKIGSWLRSGR